MSFNDKFQAGKHCKGRPPYVFRTAFFIEANVDVKYVAKASSTTIAHLASYIDKYLTLILQTTDIDKTTEAVPTRNNAHHMNAGKDLNPDGSKRTPLGRHTSYLGDSEPKGR